MVDSPNQLARRDLCDPLDLLVFRIGDEHYALDVSAVVELFRMVQVTRLPGAPAAVEGVVNVRGAVVPVFDIRGRLGRPRLAASPREHLILARTERRDLMIRADQVLDIRRVSAADRLAPGTLTVPGDGALAGVARLPDGLVLIHDPETFLSDREQSQLDEALAEAPAAEGAP